MARNTDRALDKDEAEMVAQTRALSELTQTELVDLVRRLRARRDRAQRMIRARTRAAEKGERVSGPDTGARAKKAALTDAIGRITDEMDLRKGPEGARRATEHLKAAVDAKAAAHPWRGPEDRTANTGPVENPNMKIAPSGALHAEGMRAAIARSTGDR